MNPRFNFASPRKSRVRAAIARLAWTWHCASFPLLKRAVDLALVVPALIALAPLFLAVAAAIKFGDRGPVLFHQQRVGRDGRIFRFPKFRSMVVNAEALRATIAAANQHGAAGVTFKMKRDPRITAVGRIIRRTSIDELPQLLCVLRGDMTLVGPRPPLVSEAGRYTPAERRRLSVTPGLTCIWQVSGRSEIPFPEQVVMDVDYICKPSLWADVRLIAATLPAIVRGRGAY